MSSALEVVRTVGKEELALVHIARTRSGARIEFAESLQPPFDRDRKWVLIVSTLKGCPVKCPYCDANRQPGGRLSKEEIFAQIDYMIYRRYPDGRVPASKFKVQFARMGEPMLNPAVIEVLREMRERYDAAGLIPCISTVAPKVPTSERLFDELLEIRHTVYADSDFQLQFSIHTTDRKMRRYLIPFEIWDLNEIADYGRRFYRDGYRKITLNFALMEGVEVDAAAVRAHFDPRYFLIKLTPLNPTANARRNSLKSAVDPSLAQSNWRITRELESVGFDVIESVGELEENSIGSNCGQFVGEMENESSRPRTADN